MDTPSPLARALAAFAYLAMGLALVYLLWRGASAAGKAPGGPVLPSGGLYGPEEGGGAYGPGTEPVDPFPTPNPAGDVDTTRYQPVPGPEKLPDPAPSPAPPPSLPTVEPDYRFDGRIHWYRSRSRNQWFGDLDREISRRYVEWLDGSNS